MGQGSLHRSEDIVLEARLERTLALMHRWGYAPSVAVLAKQLLGGPVEVSRVRRALFGGSDLVLRDGFVCLRGHEHLLERSRVRVSLNRKLAAEAEHIARAYAQDLIRACPLVESVALSGSLASGGFGPHDDIDFDLIVRSGTKYTSYLVAHLVGLKYSLRYRERRLDELHHTPLLPKIACINVVWTEDQLRPFSRRDENMAFELLRCVPLFGVRTFQEVLQANAWIREYFPQTFERAWLEDAPRKPSLLGRVLAEVQRNPRALAFVERLSRRIAWRLYSGVQGSRRRNPAAAARMEFLRRAKYPYEVFQD